MSSDVLVAHVALSCDVVLTPRVAQVEGLFDLARTPTSTFELSASLPLQERPWAIGAIVGPSGTGKSSLVRQLWPAVHAAHTWPPDHTILDAFPSTMSTKDVVELLGSVGFASPPNWLRPYRVLSNGEQFRADLARTLAEHPELAVVDEFTSVVDRTVARVGSAAVAKTVRRRGSKFIAVTCHEDVVEWLQPDWVYDTGLKLFQWRELQRRPAIDLTIRRCSRRLWHVFRRHHYLSADLSPVARCFVGVWRGHMVTFTAVLPLVGHQGKWREHRTVCLPDFQGVGLGSAMANTVAALTRAATGGEYRSTTSHPAFIAARNRAREWRRTSKAGFHSAHKDTRRLKRETPSGRKVTPQSARLMTSFVYVGPAWNDGPLARRLWAERPDAE